VAIDRVTSETEKARGIEEWFYCLDFNENCPNVEWLLEYLERLKEKTSSGSTASSTSSSRRRAT